MPGWLHGLFIGALIQSISYFIVLYTRVIEELTLEYLLISIGCVIIHYAVLKLLVYR